MKCNSLKCNWAVKGTGFLGYWMTPTGIKPWKKSIDAILKMDYPQNNTDIQEFIRVANHYKLPWPQWSQVLACLAEMTGKNNLKGMDADKKQLIR